MECVLAKNGNNSSLHRSLKQYLNTAQNDVRFSDNMALKGWIRGNSEAMVAEFPDMPRDPNGEPIVFFYNQNTTSGLGNITMKLDLIRDQIEQWKPVFLKYQSDINSIDGTELIGKVPRGTIIPVFPNMQNLQATLNVSQTPVKEGVAFVFEQNPELANAVYKALGFFDTKTQTQRILNSALYEVLENESEYSIDSLKVLLEQVNDNFSLRLLGLFEGDKNFYIDNSISEFGLYNAETGEIFINTKKHTDNNPKGYNILETIIHELTHRFISYNISNRSEYNKEAKNIVNLFEDFKNIYKGDNDYARTSVDEFVSEVLSNKVFQDELKKIPYKNSNIFNKFIDYLLSALNIKRDNLLSEAIIRIIEFKSLDNNLFNKFNNNAEIISSQQKQQALQLYSQYLDTIFPNNTIVYRGSEKGRTNFQTRGFFTDKLSYAKEYAFDKGFISKSGKEIVNTFLINTSSVKNVGEMNTEYVKNEPQDLVLKGVDKGRTKESGNVYATTSKNLHELGSKQDIEGFKNFVASQPMYDRKQATTPSDISILRRFASYISQKLGIQYQLVTEAEAKSLNPGYNGEPGFFVGNRAYLVIGKANVATALHEIFGHPIVELLQQQNPELLRSLYQSIPDAIIAETKALYPENVAEDGNLDAIGLKEALVRAIDAEAKNRLEKGQTRFRSLIDQLWMFVKRLFRGTTGVAGLGRYTTIKDIADLAFNTSVLDTPLGNSEIQYFKQSTQSLTRQNFISAFKDYRQEPNNDGIDEYFNINDKSKVLKRLTEEVSRIFSAGIFGKPIEEWAKDKATKQFQNANSVFKDNDKSIATGQIEMETNKFYTFPELIDYYLVLRNTNMRKGKLLHAVMEYILSTDLAHRDKVFNAIVEMGKPEIKDGKIIADAIDTSMYDYLRNSSDHFEVLKTISNVLNIKLNDPVAPDVLLNEFIMGNDELGIATRADTIVLHANGTVSFFDYQGGNLHSDNSFAETALKYFPQDKQKNNVVTKLSIKQMEITMRAFIAKMAVPDLRIRECRVFEIRNLADSSIRAVEGEFDIQDYLIAIERWIADEKPELLDKYKKLGLFERDNYMAPGMHGYDFVETATKVTGVDPNQAAKELSQKLIAISAGIQYLESQKGSPSMIETLTKQRKDLIKQWGDLQRTNKLNIGIWQSMDDMQGGIMRLFKNKYDLSKYPILQVVVDAESRGVNKALSRYDDMKAEHDALLEDVINDYKSIDPAIRSKIKIGTGNMKIFDFPIYNGDGSGFFDFAYIRKNLNGINRLGWISENDTEAWDKLTNAQKAYMSFINAEMRMAYKTGVQDTKITTLQKSGVEGVYKPVDRSKADLIGMEELGENFMPYVPPLHEEYANRAKGLWGIFNDKLKGMSLYDTTEALNGKFNEHPGMPVRFLHASEDILDAEAHSLHVEHIFSTFTRQLYLVEELEEVVAASKALTTYMEDFGKDENGNFVLENIIETLKDYTKINVTGRTNTAKDIIKIGKTLSPDNTLRAINIDRTMNKLKTFTTYSSMLLSPVLATANMSTIALLNFKSAGVNSICNALQKQLGIKDERNIDFTMADMASAHKEWLEIQRIIMSGGGDAELSKNKIWRMMKEWRIFPDDYWFANNRNSDNIIKSTKLVTPETGMFMHRLGENYGVITSFVAMVKKMEVQKGIQRKTVYDAYDIKEVDTKSGKKVHKLVWNFGTRGVEVVKGTEDDEKKVTNVIKELDSREIDHFKRAISRIHGDYRKNERTLAEQHSVAQWFIQFKKYMIRQMRNIAESKRLDSSLGHYDQVMDKEGKPILIKIKDENGVETEESYIEWMSRTTEGRYRTVLNWMLQWLSLTKSPVLQSAYTNKNLRLPNPGEYAWENLSDDQKRNVVHVAMDLALFLIGMLLKEGLFDDDKQNDKNPWFVQYKRLLENSSEGANPVDALKSVKNPIPSITRLYNIVTYGSQFLVSVVTGDRTENGDLRGLNSLENNIPFSNALRQVERFY